MASNFYFNNFNSKGEQGLIQDLIVESIKMYGIDLYYLPREIINLSSEFREQQTSRYNQAVSTVMYIKSIDGFDGEGEFLSSFGVQVREEITFSVANFTFNNDVGQLTRRDRPLESDLIGLPVDYQGITGHLGFDHNGYNVQLGFTDQDINQTHNALVWKLVNDSRILQEIRNKEAH